MYSRKTQKTEFDNTREDELSATSKDGLLLFVTQTCNSTTIFYFKLKKIIFVSFHDAHFYLILEMRHQLN